MVAFPVGVGRSQNSEDKSEQKNVGWDVKIKIEKRMHSVGRHRPERADRESKVVAQRARRDHHPRWTQCSKCFPASPEMRTEEKQKSRATDRTVLGEELEIIVMDLDWIELHARRAKMSSVVKISAAPGPERWLQFP